MYHTLWATRYGTGYRTVARQATQWMNAYCITEYTSPVLFVQDTPTVFEKNPVPGLWKIQIKLHYIKLQSAKMAWTGGEASVNMCSCSFWQIFKYLSKFMAHTERHLCRPPSYSFIQIQSRNKACQRVFNPFVTSGTYMSRWSRKSQWQPTRQWRSRHRGIHNRSRNSKFY